MRFWDSSALVALILEEAESPDAGLLIQEDPAVAIWWAAPVECESAISRAIRQGRLSPAERVAAIERANTLFQGTRTVPPTDPLRGDARSLLRRHPLSAADALQLAAARAWAEGSPSGSGFVCLDDRLRAAAQSEGFRVLPA